MKPLVGRPVSKQFPISSYFGMRKHPVYGIEKPHNGIDFACPVGTEVRAILDGKIERVGYENPADPKVGFGLRVWQEVDIKDDFYLVVYSHLSETRVEEGDHIEKGGLIGKSGNTGNTIYGDPPIPHSCLHLGMKSEDTPTYYDMDFEDEKET